MVENETFGAWLKQRRKQRDLTQAMLAARVGCAAETLRKIEAGRRRPSREILERLVEHLQVPEEERSPLLRQARARLARVEDAPGSSTPANQPLVLLRRSRLPASLTPLIGRAREVAAICNLLTGDAARLLTLVGPPGVGKTRLSTQVASDVDPHFRDGVYFVRLAPLADAARVASAIARILDIPESADQPLVESLAHALHHKHLLLVLDNFEHVVAAAPLVTTLLESAPRVTVLATSRTPLHLYGEYAYQVPPLEVPNPTELPPFEQLVEYGAIRLFEARAQAVQSEFRVTPEHAPVVAEICARLDGLPLAIELAAARLKHFVPRELLRRLSSRLDEFGPGPRNVAERHQTLRGAITWSFLLLDPNEQLLFARLGVFAGGCTGQALAAVCVSEGAQGQDVQVALESLLDHSLVRREMGRDGEPRFLMLETILAYARERLDAYGVEHVVRSRHSAYYLGVAETAEPALRGPDQAAWLERLEAEHDNLRAALAWSAARGDCADQAVRLVVALLWFWVFQWQIQEGRTWCERLLAGCRPTDQDDQHLLARAQLLFGAGMFAWGQNDFVTAQAQLQESVQLARRLGDTRTLGRALTFLGNVYVSQAEFGAARPVLEESAALLAEAGDAFGRTRALDALGRMLQAQGDVERMGAVYEEMLAAAQELGEHGGIGWAQYRLGLLAGHRNDRVAQSRYFEQCLVNFAVIEHKLGVMAALDGLGSLAALCGQARDAAILLGAAEALRAVMVDDMRPPAERAAGEHVKATARAQLSEAAWDAAWAQGQAMTLQQAAAYALQDAHVASTISAALSASRPRVYPLATAAYPHGLSAREVEVLRLLADGLTYAQIAEQLVISPHTVNTHLKTIYSKLGVTSRSAATRFVVEHHLV
ncbi:MAG TPA: LuxR C-terminal-related transcriptional regulator [Herpetosiphonaceae bacterium]|nr:LuxR C-terminal-related transcriptional regulator [Herpetosiphonaceae bacterium]